MSYKKMVMFQFAATDGGFPFDQPIRCPWWRAAMALRPATLGGTGVEALLDGKSEEYHCSENWCFNKQKQLVFIRKNANLAENWVLANRLEEIEAANNADDFCSEKWMVSPKHNDLT